MRHLQPQQQHWDWRAAGNFICGGAGAGLVTFVTLHALDQPRSLWLVAAGLMLVGAGLLFVWLEIGRPRRAMNVFAHVRTSWMSREAVAATLLLLLGAGLILELRWRAWPTAIAALVFVYCQARMLGAARAIPAWRGAAMVALIVVTALTEGVGLYALLAAWLQPPLLFAWALGTLVVVRWVLWRWWRARLAPHAARATLHAVNRNGRALQWLGTALPLLLLALGLAAVVSPHASATLFAIAGALAAGAGAFFKFELITRAGHHHGFTLPHMPVRGAPRPAP